ncbi:MAG: hypothetical protein E8F57_02330 [Methylophaga nitratireducenticrescens]|uniref:TorF family putative porin n=1 Tax=Methylophaga sp. SB9B TaxID=2570356 RepID=UPI0010A8B8AC|nr:TorF family putative porin [Methylophaga sp. SB9B]THF70781.1 MAG: hypothetical protein E8F57_02330 [Methylophaga nitratireducenticrescens]THK41092.1 hypothetical protein E8Q33_09815 [Methylophaga sp. SB9B]
MKKSIILFSTTILLLSQNALAWESENGQHSTSASIALSSDYVWRGYSQSDNKPAISGSVDYSHISGFYAGTWASNVDFMINDDDAHLEMDIYAGYAGEFHNNGIAYDVGVLRYIYPGTDGGNWNEVYGSLSYHYFSLGISHSGDVYGSGEKGTYYNLGVNYPLPEGINLGLGLGYYDYDRDVFGSGNPDSATNYLVGLSKDFAGFELNLSYSNTNSNAKDLYGSKYADSRFIFSISKSM